MLERCYTLTFISPVAVASGLGIAGLVDRTVVRDAQGLPFIPGSSVKGRLRFFAERALAVPGAPEGIWHHPPTQPLCKNRENACTVCRLFGNSSIPALLKVGQGEIEANWRPLLLNLLSTHRNPVVRADAELRPGVALSRGRRTALPDHLFFDEAVPAGIPFAGPLCLERGVTEAEERFLVLVGTLVDALGGRKAAGRGRLLAGIEIQAVKR